MSLPGEISIADALARAPSGTNKTNITTDLTQLQTDLATAVTNGGLTANQSNTLFTDLLMGFAQNLAVNLKS